MHRNPESPLKRCAYVLCFCTKNPQPMLSGISELDTFRQFWFVTLPPYGKEIEPYVPDKSEVLQSVKQLSGIVGTKAVGWLPAAAPDVHRLIF